MWIVDPGVGKTVVVSGLPQRIDKEDVPSNLQRRVVAVDMGTLVAVAKYRWQSDAVLERSRYRRCRSSCSSTRPAFSSAPGATGDGAMDAANLLKPMLSRGELRCIGTMTLDEYRKYVEKDPAFERRFQRACDKEPSDEGTLYILRASGSGAGRTAGRRRWTLRSLLLRRCRGVTSAGGSCQIRRSALLTGMPDAVRTANS